MSDPSPMSDTEIVEQLPGELRRGPAPPLRIALGFVQQVLILVLMVVIGLALAPLYLISLAVYGQPPNVITLDQALRYLRLAWTVQPTTGLPVHHRAWLSFRILRKLALIPTLGLAWQLDELLDGARLDAVAVVEPLFLISAARSGSTQMARYIEDDPGIVAPAAIQMFFPYLWLWRLVASTLGRVISTASVNERFHNSLRPEFTERHEGNLFRTDTLEGGFFSLHLNGVAPFLGAEALAEEFNLAEPADHNRELWRQTFVDYLDRLGRKTLIWHGADRSPAPPRLFVKGHFLAAADPLEQRFPDARFLTILRHPSKRLESMINFLRVNPLDPTLGEPPWSTVGPALAQTEARYCAVERAWFTKVGARRCVIPFRAYVEDLDGTMAKIYRECLDLDVLPDHVPREHTPRRRTQYSVDRKLDQVGVDRATLEALLADYIAWCENR